MINIFKCNLLRLSMVISVLVSACTMNLSYPPNNTVNSIKWYQHAKEIKKINEYQAQGIIIYSSSNQKSYIRFNLSKSSSCTYSLLLTNIFGGTEFKLRMKDSFIELIDNNGKRLFINKANQQDMFSKIDFLDILFKNISQWLIGLPGNVQNYQLDKYSYLKKLTYYHNNQSWKLNIPDYDRSIKPSLPKIIFLTTGDKYIKLYVATWTIR